MTAIFCLLGLCATIIISHASAQTPSCDNSKGNYTVNSTYYNNLNTLLSSFFTHAPVNYGFYSFSHGQGLDKAYAMGFCPGYRTPEECIKCLNDSGATLTKDCPNQKEAILWNADCTLRYSNRSMYGLMENQPTELVSFTSEVRGSVEQFNEALESLMRKLTRIAASGDSRRKDATGSEHAPYFQTIYGYTQCSPDLSSEDCSMCLDEAISKIPDCCKGKAGGNVLKPSCRIRFDPYIFYRPTPYTPYPGKRNAIIIAVSVVVIVSAVLTFMYIRLNGRNSWTNLETLQEKLYDDNDGIDASESLQIRFSIIRDATNEFSDSNKLGQGGFGTVYRGTLPNGQEVAVKRYSATSRQGDAEFKNEVLLLAKLQHRNLVTLLGFCMEGTEKLLVYEFVPNKSLDYFLFDETKRAQLDWDRRFKIIAGTARGILYLHQDSRLRIIHRDLKAGNILLDEKMNPKIADFGVARLFVVDQTHEDTQRVIGTFGYMAPEYAVYGKFSEKSDVFSFGALMLEIVSGKKIISIQQGEETGYLCHIAWRRWREGRARDIVDPTLNNGSESEIMRCIHIGLLCVQDIAAARPTMASVVAMLNSHSFHLQVPRAPAYGNALSGIFAGMQLYTGD